MLTFLTFIFSILLAFLPSFFGNVFSASLSQDSWYSLLIKPPLNPPFWSFPIVWDFIHVSLGLALFLALFSGVNKSRNPLFIFVAHMIANGSWSYLFFEMRWLMVSTLWIIILLIIALHMRKEFSEENLYAGILIWPYIIWLCFTFYLNSGMYILSYCL